MRERNREKLFGLKLSIQVEEKRERDNDWCCFHSSNMNSQFTHRMWPFVLSSSKNKELRRLSCFFFLYNKHLYTQ